MIDISRFIRRKTTFAFIITLELSQSLTIDRKLGHNNGKLNNNEVNIKHTITHETSHVLYNTLQRNPTAHYNALNSRALAVVYELRLLFKPRPAGNKFSLHINYNVKPLKKLTR